MADKRLVVTKDLLHAIREIPASHLTYVEKYILIIILSCINTKNETWHGVDALARFSCMSVSTIKRHIKKLEQKKFISIRRPAHYTHKETNHYFLNLKLIQSYYGDNFTDVDKLGVPETPDMQVGYHTATQSGVSQLPNRVSQRAIKRERKMERKRERGEATLLSPVDFSINPKSAELIEAMGLSEDDANDVIDEFVEHYTEGKGKNKTSDDWNRMLQIWLKREMGYMEERQQRQKLKEPEEKPWYHKETEHMQRGNGMAALGKILENLRPNGQGGSTNGLGTKGKGKD